MDLTIEQIARAFSAHNFDLAISHLAEDVTWTFVGGEIVTGRESVEAALRGAASELADVATAFTRFKTVVGADCVINETVAEYAEKSGDTSIVAACDILEFAHGLIAQIRSYNIEL